MKTAEEYIQKFIEIFGQPNGYELKIENDHNKTTMVIEIISPFISECGFKTFVENNTILFQSHFPGFELTYKRRKSNFNIKITSQPD